MSAFTGARHLDICRNSELTASGCVGRGVLRLEAARRPVARRDARAERAVLGPRLAQRARDLERRAHAVLETAAVAVAPPVGERRKELVQQVAVRRV